ncbi:MAG: c-type cytochrome [Planctomycetota bacterium]
MTPTPLWLKLAIAALVAWGVGYVSLLALVGPEAGATGRFERAVEAEAEAVVGTMDRLSFDAESLARVRSDPTLLSHGKAIYAANCASCHHNDGRGTVTAPNLTDNAWIAATTAMDVLTITEQGIADRGMPAWKGRLGYNDLIIVSGYVTSLHDTNVEGGHRPEGEVVERLE